MSADAISAVIPVYNSEETLAPLVDRLERVLAARGEPFEILLVNDCSRDGSWAVIAGLTTRRPAVRGIDLSRNYGQHNALLCGIRAARYPVIVTLDDDLQHPPEEIPRLLAALGAGHDVVYGYPEKERHGFWRDLASQMTKLALQHALGAATARHLSAFRAFRTPLREAFARYSGPHVSIDVLLTWGTTRFTAVPVRHESRRHGASNYTFTKLVAHAVNMFTGFSPLPLRLASWLGFGCTFLGLLAMLWVFCAYLIYGPVVPGFAFLASLVATFAGAQMFALGILGEYIARIHFRLMDKPSYVVRSWHGDAVTGESRAA